MASQATTSWVLNLVDRVTKPIKSISASVKQMTASTYAMSDAVRFSEKETKSALSNAKNYYESLRAKVKQNEVELKKLEKAHATATAGTIKSKAAVAFERQKQKVEQLRGALSGAEGDMKDLNKQMGEFTIRSKNWAELATGINQTMEIISKVTKGLSFAVDISNLTGQWQQLTNLSGDALDDLVAKSNRLSKVYGDNAGEIATAVNAMTKQIGGSYSDNLQLLEAGYKKGANLHGNLLSQMSQYAPVFAEMGISAKDAIALIAKASKDGLSPDKVIDGIKEAGLSIQRMGKSEQKTLEGIGISIKDLTGKTTFEAVQMVSKAMQGITTDARGQVLNKVFRKNGEESGNAFIEGLAGGIPDIADLPEVEETAEGFKSFFADISTWAGQKLGTIGVYAQNLEPLFQALAGGVPLIQALSKATWLQTLATGVWAKTQWLLNVAMNANPIGLLVTGILALGVLIQQSIKHFENWGDIVLLFMGPIGWLISAFVRIKDSWDEIVEAFKSEGFLGGLKKIGGVLLDVLLVPIKKILGWIGKITGWEWAKKIGESVSTPTPEEPKGDDPESVNSYITKPANKLTFTPDKEKKKEKDGLNLGSGRGGIKSIVMTINNYFTITKDQDQRSVADKVVGRMTDQLRDALINIG